MGEASQRDAWRWPAEVTSDWRVGTFPPGVHWWSDQAVGFTSSSLYLSTRRAFWTHTLVMLDICTDVYFDSHVCAVAYSGHFCFGGDLSRPSITIATVDRFYLNLVICLQLDIALLVQNSVKIWHCLSELWQCMQGVTFFVDTVYIYRKICIISEHDCGKLILPNAFLALTLFLGHQQRHPACKHQVLVWLELGAYDLHITL